MSTNADAMVIGGVEILPNTRQIVNIPVAPVYTQDSLSLNINVVRGKKPGPTLFVCAAIHGDEINGVEIIRRLLMNQMLEKLRGTLIAIPIVNVYGFVNQTRDLPDGRDLNRCFPGSARGSLAARIAETFMSEIVSHCTHGIDLHTGARHRSNFPQIRANLLDPETLAMTNAFGAPIAINARIRDGSLRQACAERGVPVLLYESCEALRFDEIYIRAGVKGILNAMRHIGMLRKSRASTKPPMISEKTAWVRAPDSGVLRVLVSLGELVEEGQVIGIIADPLGIQEVAVVADQAGIVIGRTNLPLAYEGDALFHIAQVSSETDWRLEVFTETYAPAAESSPVLSEVPPIAT
jgi:predicted deacylase